MSRGHVLIQAGHEGRVRNSGTGTKPTHGTGGIAGRPPEVELTPMVADVATDVLREAGWVVIRENALTAEHEVALALAVHFDGSGTRCASGASIGYPSGSPRGSNKPAANSWRKWYSGVWPYKWMADNFTKNLSGYYGFSHWKTGDAELVLEMGELTCLEQNEWLVPRVTTGWLGRELAAWISNRLLEVPGVADNYGKLGHLATRPAPFTARARIGVALIAHAREVVLDAERTADNARRLLLGLEALD